MRSRTRPSNPGEYVGRPCAGCGRLVEGLVGMVLVCRPKIDPDHWEPWHSVCYEEAQQAEADQLLGGRR